MKTPVFISYEQWVDNVIAFCLKEGLEFAFVEQNDRKSDVVDVSKTAYDSQKKTDAKLWYETVTQ